MSVPKFLYGTAWKEENTESLVRMALQAGFRGIDTANQRKHYFEEEVGRGIASAVEAGILNREELFVQTKFTHLGGQDHRLPYDPKTPIANRVRQSMESSERHLGKIDSYILHGPTQRIGLGPDDLEAWGEMIELHQQGRVRYLGVSNVTAEQLHLFCQGEVKPRFVQNRCYARLGWDAQVRKVCKEHDVQYQGFSLLTANQCETQHPVILNLAKERSWTACQVVFRFALDIGMLPLTGTSSSQHMGEDLSVMDAEPLTTEQLQAIESMSLP